MQYYVRKCAAIRITNPKIRVCYEQNEKLIGVEIKFLYGFFDITSLFIVK